MADGSEIEDLRKLVEEHRRTLAELESQLAALGAPEGPPDSRRVLRLARAEVRRAARRVERYSGDTIWVAEPAYRLNPERQRQLREIAEARRQSWRRTGEALAAIDRGDRQPAREALEEVLATELAIQAVVDAIQVPELWYGIADELSRASDTIIETARKALRSLDRPTGDPSLGQLATAQSSWNRAWRTFVQVIPASAPANTPGA